MRSLFKRTLPAVLAGTALLAASAAALAADPAATPSDDIQKQLNDLQAKVSQLQDQQKQNDQATINSVLSDAHQRSLNLADSVPFGTNWEAGKFSLRSEDGNFVLHPWFQLQFRGVANYRDDVAGESDTASGFELRRMKFGVDGNLYYKDTTYLFNWATDRNTGNLVLEEAWVRTKFADDWSIRGGQLKDPFAHESIVSSKKLLAADRTLVTDFFTGGDNFVQGVALGYQHDALQTEVALTDGSNEANRNFQDFPTNAWDYGVAGRAQYKLMGDWKDYDQFSAMKVKNDLLVIGGGVDFSQAGNTNQILHTVDAQYSSTTGLGVFGALYGRYTMNSPKNGLTTPAAENDTYDWGAVAQVSYLIPDTKWEPFARYDYLGFDSDTVAANVEQHVHEITAGVNYYMHGHDAKFTLDVMYLPNGSPVSDSGSDVLSSTDDEIVVRGQFQLLL
ncbi:hypothetical protein BH10PLA1_BH10PLA1_08060 [soil metagenome]